MGIQTGSEDPYKWRKGLRLALNKYTSPYGERLLYEIKMILFVMGVGIVNPNMPFHDVYKQGIQVLIEADVEVAACVSIAGAIGLEKEQKNRNQTRPRLRLRRRARQPGLHDKYILRV